MSINSDCKQCTESKLGWVHSAHTQNPGRVHTALAVPRSWTLLRAQPTGCAHVARTSSAGRALVERELVATRPGSLPQVATSKLQVSTPNFNKLGRDLKSMSRPASAPPTGKPLSRPKTLVATPNHHKASRTMSRHQFSVATPLKPLQVATSKWGCDTFSPAQPQARSQHQTRSRPSWRLTYVATSISCRDLVCAHSGISRSQLQNPGRDLPHCHPCRDLKK